MDSIKLILTGGFLKGYRTHIAGWLLIAEALARYATGDLSLADLASQIPTLAAGIGLTAGRAAIQELIDLLRAAAPVLLAESKGTGSATAMPASAMGPPPGEARIS